MAQVHWSDYTSFAIALFALINPFTKIPFIIASSRNNERAVMNMALASTITIICVLFVAHFIGVAALQVLGTTLPSFQIGGGVVVLLTGLTMLFGQNNDSKNSDIKQIDDQKNYFGLAVSPLGIPMLAGPGVITKVILDSHPGTGIENDIHSVIVIAVVAAVCGVVVASSLLLMRALGKSFFTVMGRISGLIIAAVGIEMIVRGVYSHIQILGS